MAQNAWNVVRNWCLYWGFTPWPLILPQIYGFGSKNAELTTLRFPRIGRNDNYWNFTNIYEQILFFLHHIGWITILFSKKPIISYVFVTKYQSCHFVLWQEGWVVNSAFWDPKWSISGGLGAQRIKCQYRHQFYIQFPAFWNKGIFFTLSKSFFASWRPPWTDLILRENHCSHGELPRNITNTFSQCHWLFILLKLYLETLHEWSRKQQVPRTGYLVFNFTLLLALHNKQANTSWLWEWDLTHGVAYALVDLTGVRFCLIHLCLDLPWYIWICPDALTSVFWLIHLSLDLPCFTYFWF